MTEADFLAAIITAPDDDWPRLIYADWLDEQGQCERAEFIRVQCYKVDLPYHLQYRIDKHGWRHTFGVGHILDEVLTKYRESTDQYPGYSWGSSESPTGPGLYKCGAAEVWIEQKPLFKLVCRRGFLACVTCTAEDWLRHGDAITACQPIEEVRLTTWPVVTLGITTGKDGKLTSPRWPRVKTWVLPPQPSFTSNDVYRMIAEVADDYEPVQLPILNFRIKHEAAELTFETRPPEYIARNAYIEGDTPWPLPNGVELHFLVRPIVLQDPRMQFVLCRLTHCTPEPGRQFTGSPPSYCHIRLQPLPELINNQMVVYTRVPDANTGTPPQS